MGIHNILGGALVQVHSAFLFLFTIYQYGSYIFQEMGVV